MNDCIPPCKMSCNLIYSHLYSRFRIRFCNFLNMCLYIPHHKNQYIPSHKYLYILWSTSPRMLTYTLFCSHPYRIPCTLFYNCLCMTNYNLCNCELHQKTLHKNSNTSLSNYRRIHRHS